jgi:hypothetical protein
MQEKEIFMTPIKSFNQGIHFVLQGLTLIIQHPVVLVYSLIFLSIPAAIAISRFFYITNTHTPEHAHKLFTQPSLETLFELTSIVTFLILLTFVAACVSIHTFFLLTHRHASVRATLKAFLVHAPHLALWSILNTLLIYAGLALLHVLDIRLHEIPWSAHALSLLHSTAIIVWSVVVFFLIPIHALEESSLIESLKRSYTLARKHIFAVIAVKIAYIAILHLYRMMLVPLFMHLTSLANPSAQYRHLAEGIMISMLMIMLFTAYIVFVTMLYHDHVKEIGK